MNDDRTAKDYNIEGGSVLHLVLAYAEVARTTRTGQEQGE